MESKRKATSLYNQQIKALLAKDWKKFEEIIKYNESLNSGPIKNHMDAWSFTGGNEISLFATLPNCSVCASQVEWNELGLEDINIVQKVLRVKKVTLPDLMNREKVTFTKEQLLEFKRRQLSARF